MYASKTYSFEKLQVWQETREFTKDIYNITACFPKEEVYGITSQMRRAVLSISSNIAEGSGRTTVADQGNFYRIAYSSLMEVLSQLLVAVDLGFVENEKVEELRQKIDKIGAQISALRKSLKV